MTSPYRSPTGIYLNNQKPGADTDSECRDSYTPGRQVALQKLAFGDTVMYGQEISIHRYGCEAGSGETRSGGQYAGLSEWMKWGLLYCCMRVNLAMAQGLGTVKPQDRERRYSALWPGPLFSGRRVGADIAAKTPLECLPI